MKLICKLAFVAALALVNGCAFQKQVIHLQPSLYAGVSDIGANKPTMVSVIDERSHLTLGSLAPGGHGEQITLANDIVATVKESVVEGLRRQAFLPAELDSNQLRVEIRNLDYVVNTGFWANNLNIEFLLKGICLKGDSRPYEQTYRGVFNRNVQSVQGLGENSNFINDVVSKAINALLMDENMLNCLAR